MAELTFTAVGTAPFETKTGTTPSDADDLREVQIPAWADVVTIFFETNDGKLTHTGTDEDPIGSDYIPIIAGSPVELAGHLAGRSIYVTSAVGSTTFYVSCEARKR